jgi:hypothetical protein
MFSYIFGEVGKHLTNNLVGSKALSYIASGVGSYIGHDLDRFILSSDQKVTTGKIDSFSLSQTISYGVDIPIVFGRVSISGNIIWLGSIKEDVETYQKKYGAIFKRKIIRNEYCYLADFAVAVCQGEARVVKIFADNQELVIDNDKIKIYSGTPGQSADPTIVSYEGVKRTPAFRDLCYVVFKDFPLDDFGGFPRFVFEVESEMVSVPEIEVIKFNYLAGGFSLDTNIIYKYYFQQSNGFELIASDDIALNKDFYSNQSSSIVELNLLRNAYNNLKWLEIEIFWYVEILGDEVSIIPLVTEREKNSKTKPYEWRVFRFNRDNAKLLDSVNHKEIKATQNDQSLRNFYNKASEMGFKVVLKISLVTQAGVLIGALKEHLKDAQKQNLIKSFNVILEHYISLRAQDAFNLNALEFIITEETKQKIPFFSKPQPLDNEALKPLEQGFHVDNMLKKILAPDLHYYKIDVGDIYFDGLVIKNFSYGDLLLSLSMVSSIEFYSFDGVVNIKNIIERKKPDNLDSEMISYREKNYTILYSDGRSSINKHFIISDFTYEFIPIEIPFVIKSPQRILMNLEKKLNNKKYFAYCENFYSINNHYYHHNFPSTLEFKKNFVIHEHYFY